MEGIVRRRNSGWSKLNQISSLDVDGDGESFESCTQFLYVRYAINRFYKISVFAKSFGISFHACCFETFSIKYLWLFQDRRYVVHYVSVPKKLLDNYPVSSSAISYPIADNYRCRLWNHPRWIITGCLSAFFFFFILRKLIFNTLHYSQHLERV